MFKGIKKWFQDIKEEYPFYGVRCLIPKRIKNWYYQICCYFFPYNVVKIRTLRRTWCDRDQVMFHAPFQILVDFVEKEWMPDRGTFFDIEKERKELAERQPGLDEINQRELQGIIAQNASTQEIWTLYNWWTKVRPNRKDPREHIRHPKYVSDENGFHEIFLIDGDEEVWDNAMQLTKKLESEWEKEDEEMFMRLIKIREHLWT